MRIWLAPLAAGTLLAGLATSAQAAGTGEIVGTVTNQGGSPLQGICVFADDGDIGVGSALTAADGTYTIVNLPPKSTYRVEFFTCGVGNYAFEYYDDKPSEATADAVTVADGAATRLDAQLGPGGSISGSVFGEGGVPMTETCVDVEGVGTGGAAFTETDSSGNYTVKGLRTDAYKIFYCPDPGWDPEFYNDRPTFEEADPVSVIAGAGTLGIDAVLERPAIPPPPNQDGPWAITSVPPPIFTKPECDLARAKLAKAKQKLRRLKRRDAQKKSIAKAKQRVKAARAAVESAC